MHIVSVVLLFCLFRRTRKQIRQKQKRRQWMPSTSSSTCHISTLREDAVVSSGKWDEISQSVCSFWLIWIISSTTIFQVSQARCWWWVQCSHWTHQLPVLLWGGSCSNWACREAVIPDDQWHTQTLSGTFMTLHATTYLCWDWLITWSR